MPTLEPLTGPIAEHAEGPVWDAEHGQLLCVDLEQGAVLAVAPPGSPAAGTAGGVRRVHVDAAVGVLRPRRSGGWVAACQRRFLVWDDVEALLAGTERARALPLLWTTHAVRFNDGGCDPAGRFYAGAMAYDQHPGGGSLWRLDPDGTATQLDDEPSSPLAAGDGRPGLTIPNGLHVSDDGTRAHFVDSPTRRVDLLHLDPGTGAVVGREPWVDLASLPGLPGGDDAVPDGLVVDADGGVWVAHNGAGAVLHLDPDGSLVERWEVPVPAVTACTLAPTGAPGRSLLLATTSTQGVDTAAHPGSGGVFTAEVGAGAREPRSWAG